MNCLRTRQAAKPGVVGKAFSGSSSVSTVYDGALLAQLAIDISSGKVPCEVLRQKRNDVLTARAWLGDGKSVIVKLWNRPTLRGALRRFTRTNTGYREWECLRRLRQRGARVPEALGYFRLRDTTARHTEALVCVDVGPCSNAIDRVKELLEARGDGTLNRLEDGLIGITVAMVNGGVIDTDHRLGNFVITEEGDPIRLDFEHGVRVLLPNIQGNLYGIMLGTLIGSYAFVVQPDTNRARYFAQRLAERLGPSRRVLRRACIVVEAMLEGQRRQHGIDTRLELPW